MKKLSIILALCLLLTLAGACGTAGSTDASVSYEASEVSYEQDDMEADESEEAEQTAPEAAEEAEEASVGASEEAEPEEKEYLVTFPLEEDFEITACMSIHPLLMSSGLVSTDGTGLGWITYLEDRTGVDIQMDLYSVVDSAEKQNLMIASGDYTDVIIGNFSYPGGTDGAVEEDVLMDIYPYGEYMPDYMDALYSDVNVLAGALTSEYYLTAFYGITDVNAKSDFGPAIRQDWLDAEDLETPVTYDDLHEVLKVFKDKYDATMWVTATGGVSGNFSGGYGVMEYCSGVGFPAWTEDGEFKFSATEEKFRDYIEMMHQWYDEGLIYPDFVSQGSLEYPDNSIIGEQKIGVWFTNVAMLNAEQDVLNVDAPEGDIEAFAWPVLEAGQAQGVTYGKGAGTAGVDAMTAVSVTTAAEDVETLCAVFNEFYTEEGSRFCNWGIEDETYTVDESGNKRFTELVTDDEYGLGVDAMLCFFVFKDGPYRYDYSKYTSFYDDKEMNACIVWTPEEGRPTTSIMSAEQTTEYNNIKADITTMYQEYTVKFITGYMDIDKEWDNFLAALEGCGLSRFVELGQLGVDQYSERMETIEEMMAEATNP